jgi:hypothetical protein
VAVPAGGDEHGAALDVDAAERVRLDRPAVPPAAADHQPGEVDDAAELERGQVGGAREPVRRRVDVGPGVRDEVDAPDLEGGARRVAGARRLVREEGRDDRRRDPRVGDHPVDDLVAQVHRARLHDVA